VSAFNDSGSFVETGGLSFNGYARSTDGGLTFKDLKFVPAPPPGFLQGDPVVQCASASIFYQSSLFDDGSASTISVSKSTDGGITFNAPVVAASAGTTGNFLDKSWMTIDPTNRKQLYVTYTNFGASTTLEIVRSTDGGATWSKPKQLASASGNDFVQGSQVIVGPKGQVYVIWEDFKGTSFPPINRKLFIRKSVDNGVTFSPAQLISKVTFVGNAFTLENGFRSGFDFPSVAINRKSGKLFVAWHDGRFGSKPDPTSPTGRYNFADILVTTSTDEGTTWSAPVQVNDGTKPTPDKKDQYMPAIGVDKTGAVAVCYYSRRRDVNNLKIDRFCAYSTTGKAGSWTNRRFTKASFPPVFGVDDLINTIYMGDYDTLATDFTRVNAGFVGAYGDNSKPTAPDVRSTSFTSF
ncbi:MAG: sialidase family protein, partial [Thermosynechococcaceae cyanobacterium]